jgi:CBS domain-containing protein
MEKHVVFVESYQTAEYCMALMTEKRIRHLPVIREGRLEGVISIGDLMKSMIADREFNIDQLVRYVSG